MIKTLILLIILPALAWAQPVVRIPEYAVAAQRATIPVLYEQFTGAVAVELQITFNGTQVLPVPIYHPPGWLMAYKHKSGQPDTLHIAAATLQDSLRGEGILFVLDTAVFKDGKLDLFSVKINDQPVREVSGLISKLNPWWWLLWR